MRKSLLTCPLAYPMLHSKGCAQACSLGLFRQPLSETSSSYAPSRDRYGRFQAREISAAVCSTRSILQVWHAGPLRRTICESDGTTTEFAHSYHNLLTRKTHVQQLYDGQWQLLPVSFVYDHVPSTSAGGIPPDFNEAAQPREKMPHHDGVSSERITRLPYTPTRLQLRLTTHELRISFRIALSRIYIIEQCRKSFDVV